MSCYEYSTIISASCALLCSTYPCCSEVSLKMAEINVIGEISCVIVLKLALLVSYFPNYDMLYPDHSMNSMLSFIFMRTVR
jgi:hypothetical protein